MSAYQILLHELAQYGRTTYRELCRRHPEYSRDTYAAAVYKARKLGIVQTIGHKHVQIVAIGTCPCCGRVLETEAGE